MWVVFFIFLNGKFITNKRTVIKKPRNTLAHVMTPSRIQKIEDEIDFTILYGPCERTPPRNKGSLWEERSDKRHRQQGWTPRRTNKGQQRWWCEHPRQSSTHPPVETRKIAEKGRWIELRIGGKIMEPICEDGRGNRWSEFGTQDGEIRGKESSRKMRSWRVDRYGTGLGLLHKTVRERKRRRQKENKRLPSTLAITRASVQLRIKTKTKLTHTTVIMALTGGEKNVCDQVGSLSLVVCI